jgi:hypothetical protein
MDFNKANTRVIVVTNNPQVSEKYGKTYPITWVDGDVIDVLKQVRDFVHNGQKLFSHPLSGSIKPNETPYKSVLMSANKFALDFDSLRIIENSIALTEKFPVRFDKKTLPESILNDFQKVDCSLITSALTSITK